MAYRDASIDDIERLRRRWQGLAPPQCPPGIIGSLLEKYAEPHRHYHTTGHLVELFGIFDRNTEPIRDEAAIQLAIFFHDIVYNIPGLDNEEKSALRAIHDLKKAGFDDKMAQRAADLIRMTKTHDCAPGDLDAAAFLDMDMAVLGAPANDYMRYQQSIREEYMTFYTLQNYCEGRIRHFLEPSLKKDRLFMTDRFENLYGAQARLNMRNEIGILQSLLAGPDANLSRPFS